ncbi:T9SS type A sorting domain-containing protein [Gramella sp. AN32]|uniref:T9SS type A sorting domain-containing protein n=1 Tax=Christiangramia antarctica TaxID=2058158 RepID=A0ABW5X710_9FLAO|nr:T9SS type A sorting domain-containing protein [Gramella sp. AN32]
MMQSINASGTDGINDQGSISFSIGQTFYEHNNAQDVVLLQGVQQSAVYTEIITKKAPPKQIIMKAYPNPMTNYVILSIPEYEKEKYYYEFYTISGKLLKTAAISGSKTIIPVEELPTSIYLLKVIGTNNTIQTLKLIKK